MTTTPTPITITESTVRGERIMELLGSFWNSIYAANDQVAAYCAALGQTELQSFQDIAELIDCSGRLTTPVYRKIRWKQLKIKESERLPGKLLEYGDLIYFGNDPITGVIYSYGVSPEATYDYSAPSGLISAPAISDQIINPIVLWTQDVDYVIDTKELSVRFRLDPFSVDGITKNLIYNSSGVVVDRELTLWVMNGEYDAGYMREQYGSVLGLHQDSSSEHYKTLVNTVFDAVTAGSVHYGLNKLLSVLTDTPLVLNDSEMVTEIVTNTTHKLVITDKSVYRVSSAATISAAVGDTVRKGNPITNAFEVFPLHSTLPNATKVPALAIGVDLLKGNYISDLVFHNEFVPLIVTNDADGRTRVEFELGGHPDDVRLFWDTVHENGTADDAISLAQLMDDRYPPAQTPDPGAINLPTEVNPFSFLATNILANNTTLVVLNTSSFGTNVLDYNRAQAFRLFIPPTTLILMLVKVDITGDSVPMADSGSETYTGYTETLVPDGWKAPSPLSETSPHTFAGSETFEFFSA